MAILIDPPSEYTEYQTLFTRVISGIGYILIPDDKYRTLRFTSSLIRTPFPDDRNFKYPRNRGNLCNFISALDEYAVEEFTQTYDYECRYLYSRDEVQTMLYVQNTTNVLADNIASLGLAMTPPAVVIYQPYERIASIPAPINMLRYECLRGAAFSLCVQYIKFRETDSAQEKSTSPHPPPPQPPVPDPPPPSSGNPPNKPGNASTPVVVDPKQTSLPDGFPVSATGDEFKPYTGDSLPPQATGTCYRVLVTFTLANGTTGDTTYAVLDPIGAVSTGFTSDGHSVLYLQCNGVCGSPGMGTPQQVQGGQSFANPSQFYISASIVNITRV